MKKRAWTGPSAIVLLAGVAGYAWSPFHAPDDRDKKMTDSPTPLKSGARSGKERPAGAGPAFRDARDFLTMLDSAKLEDLPALWASQLTGNEEEQNSGALSARQIMIMERWAELDAPGALEFARAQKAKGPLVAAIFSVWADLRPDLALAAMKDEKDPGTQAAEAAGWLQSAKGDPVSTIAMASRLTWLDASKLTKEDLLRELPEGFLETFYAADPSGLKNLSSWLPPWFGELMEVLEWKKSLNDHPGQALAAMESMKLTRDKLTDMLPALEPLAKKEPERVAELLMKLAERPGESLLIGTSWNDGRTKLLETLVGSLGPQKPERLGRILAKIGAFIPGSEIVTQTLLKTNPAAALKLLSAFPAMDQIANLFLPPLPAMEAGEAFSLVRDVPPSYYRDKIMERALLDMNGKDPAAAQAWIEGLPEGELRNSAQLTLDLAASTPEMRMMERVGRQEFTGPMDEDAKTRLTNVTAMAAMNDLPETAQRVSQWPGGPARDAALEVVASRAASRDDPQAALKWAASLPEESQQAAAYSGIAKGWTGADPVAASEWLAALPEGPLREAAVAGFAGSIVYRDPEAGLQWAATLNDSQDRLRLLQQVTDKWKTKDSAAAAEGIKNFPGLSANERNILLQSLK